MLMARWALYIMVGIALLFLGLVWVLVFIVWKKCQRSQQEQEEKILKEKKNKLIKYVEKH